MFRVLLVLDILNNYLVHAVKGEREKYNKIESFSQISDTSHPLEIVENIKPKEVYIADLNRLHFSKTNEENVDTIYQIRNKAKTYLDWGIESINDVHYASKMADHLILGTESTKLETLKAAVSSYPGRVSVSIDQKNGKILKVDECIPDDPLKIIKLLNGLNIKDIIYLDLSRVGTSKGFDEKLVSKLVLESKHDILLGGGIRDCEDIKLLNNIGVKGALAATALHNGSIPLSILKYDLDTYV
ncbi:HisA/HisF-related TIM barrel protein [Methanosalsum natronophilum]|uniref:Phosphoribosylformimino-5-aminoimidazole carboxamide ribotide isomerase n=1 Tax=Methanosalsum natronophilum TaxID=768733 RepID=A0A3R7VSM8_9EURY|nr:HisA/HisF-related TIM barrel protein [Methanosalsum natronophilum]MCS3923135.1 phosphoribosylformimino-5-aminoimidazole carboxamide ribotide isomerase [Methanosalsum natronophilum]RQD83467.1 MAG: phosphoribosylformimino-5-aminoimidazole carboxamide ribotide isomerase [Methanosalsum natronophilum]